MRGGTCSSILKGADCASQSFQIWPPVTPFTLSNCTPIRCNNGGENAFGEAVWWRSAGGIDGMDLSDLIGTVGDGRSFGMRLRFEIDNGCLFGVPLRRRFRGRQTWPVLRVGTKPGRDILPSMSTRTCSRCPKSVAPATVSAALPPRAARRGPSGHGIVLSRRCEPSALAAGNVAAAIDGYRRQLVELGFKEPLGSERPRRLLAEGSRGWSVGTGCARRHGGTPAGGASAAGGRQVAAASCLAPRSQPIGHLVLVHTTELVELGLVEEGIGRGVGLCVRQGNNVGGKQPGISGAQGAGGPAAAPKAWPRTRKVESCAQPTWESVPCGMTGSARLATSSVDATLQARVSNFHRLTCCSRQCR